MRSAALALAISIASIAPALAVDDQTFGVWTVTIQKSAIDGVVHKVEARNRGKEPAGFYDDEKYLLLRCSPDTTEVFVRLFGPMAWPLMGGQERVKVVSKMPGGTVMREAWLTGSSGSVQYPFSGLKFIRSLPAAGDFLVGVESSSGEYKEAAFPLDGIDQVRAAMQAGCAWPE